MPAFKFKVEAWAGARRFQTLSDAERFARSQCAKDGETRRVQGLVDGRNGELVAEIRRDAFDRVWTDVCQMQGSLI
jgi:hypothetical protein